MMEPASRNHEVRRQLAIEMFRRSRSGGVIHLVFLPLITIGIGYTELQPRTGWFMMALSLSGSIARSILAQLAYANRENIQKVAFFRRVLRGLIVWQAIVWGALVYLMLHAFGPTPLGFLVVACAVGWISISPAIIATDLRLSQVLSVVNVTPLAVCAVDPTFQLGFIGITLSIALLGLAWLLAHMQHSSMKTMLETRLDLEAAHVALGAAKIAAEQAAEAKGQFLANMSHEIRTPLNGVIGLAEVLQQGALPPLERELAGDLQRSGQHLLAIVNDILDLSKISAGRMTIEAVPVPLRQMIRDTVAPFQQAALAKDLKLSFALAADLPETILADPVRLRQILSNLLANAVKFTLQGSITLSIERFAQNGGLLSFAVTDTGIGISADRQEEIFAEFSQAETSTTRRFGGTGLGLSICRKLADLMHGALSLDSTPGKGSRFEFRLPLVAAEGTASIDGAGPKRFALPSTLRVLVVDDNRVNQRVCSHLIERAGAQAETAADGESAIERHAAQPFDLILMDCHMPGLDGWATTERIRALENAAAAKTPIFALTADVFPEVRERCMASGMNGYLTKPVQLDELCAALQAVAPAFRA